LDTLRESIVFLREDPESLEKHPALVKNIGSSVIDVSGNDVSRIEHSVGGNSYYESLQKTLSRYSRGSSDSAHKDFQERYDEKLAQPKLPVPKFQRPQSAGPTFKSEKKQDDIAEYQTSLIKDDEVEIFNDGDAKDLKYPRPQSAHFKKDMYISGHISDRRTSNMPLNRPKGKQARNHDEALQNHSKTSRRPNSSYVTKKRSIQISASGDEVSASYNNDVVGNFSSYFADEEYDRSKEAPKSSYLLLSRSLLRRHTQSGATLGTYPVSFIGLTPDRNITCEADPDEVEQLKNIANIKDSEEIMRTRMQRNKEYV
jgi:hypothetical protein